VVRGLGQTLEVKTPISEKQIRDLNAGDTIYVTGTVVTARDQAHKRMVECIQAGEKIPVDLNGLAVYHCGPVVKRVGDKWTVIAAGPTTSMRMEQYEDVIIKKFNVRLIIGKGGMGPRTQEAMREIGAVYGAFTGGAAVLAAKLIKEVKQVEWLDLGMPEALWALEVENFGPLIISIDTHGHNLFEEVRSTAQSKISKTLSETPVSSR